METSLHRQLKARYAGDDGEIEVKVGRYRIDVVRGGLLIEIQHGGLAAIRDKVRALAESHDVLVVKPIVAEKVLVKRKRKTGCVVDRRRSPKRGRVLDIFHDLVHFTRALPHPRVALEVPLVDVEEWRRPGHGRRRRRRASDCVVDDQRLLAVRDVFRFRDAADLAELLPAGLPQPFDTGELAEALDAHRWVAQRVAYCLREMGVARAVGKRGNAIVYRLAGREMRRRAA